MTTMTEEEKKKRDPLSGMMPKATGLENDQEKEGPGKGIVGSFTEAGEKHGVDAARQGKKNMLAAKQNSKQNATHILEQEGSDLASGLMDGVTEGDVISLFKRAMTTAFQAAMKSLTSVAMLKSMRKNAGEEMAEDMFQNMGNTKMQPEPTTKRSPGQ